jgi:hypothetical protein
VTPAAAEAPAAPQPPALSAFAEAFKRAEERRQETQGKQGDA